MAEESDSDVGQANASAQARVQMSTELIRTTSVDQAIGVLADGDNVRLISGGIAIGLMMRQRLIAPKVLVAMQELPELNAIRVSDGELRIGAQVTLRAIAHSKRVRSQVPALSQACEVVGNTRIRNVGTLAGNLAEADYASDPPPVLMCLGAYCIVRGPERQRSIPISDLITGFHSTSLSSDEVITEVCVPRSLPGERSTYLKYVSRSSKDRPCVGVAARAVIEGGVIHDMKLVVGAVADLPTTVDRISNAVLGRPLDDATINDVAEDYAAALGPLYDMRGSSWYRVQIIRVLVRRALNSLREAS